MGTQKPFYVFFRGEGTGKALFGADDTSLFGGEGISPILQLNIVDSSGSGNSSSRDREDDTYVPW